MVGREGGILVSLSSSPSPWHKPEDDDARGKREIDLQRKKKVGSSLLAILHACKRSRFYFSFLVGEWVLAVLSSVVSFAVSTLVGLCLLMPLPLCSNTCSFFRRRRSFQSSTKHTSPILSSGKLRQGSSDCAICSIFGDRQK